MARYQVPPDPRKPDSEQSRRQPGNESEPIPWKWLGLGLLVTVAAIGVALLLANALLSRPPLTAESPPEPTIIVLTAPPSPMPSATAVFPTPTPIPTFTPIPTPDTAVAPPEVTTGYFAQVANTDGIGVTVRGGPSTSNASLTIADEGALVLVLAGPSEGNGLLWWQIRLEDGTEGWAAADYLEPAAAP